MSKQDDYIMVKITEKELARLRAIEKVAGKMHEALLAWKLFHLAEWDKFDASTIAEYEAVVSLPFSTPSEVDPSEAEIKQ